MRLFSPRLFNFLHSDFVDIHYGLQSYLLTHGSAALENGTSVIQPLADRSSDIEKIVDIFVLDSLCYLLGPDILVAPIYESGGNAEVGAGWAEEKKKEARSKLDAKKKIFKFILNRCQARWVGFYFLFIKHVHNMHSLRSKFHPTARGGTGSIVTWSSILHRLRRTAQAIIASQ